MLRKKPDKPTIQMIEVANGNFAMREHPVDDNFEIKDLDVNYGYGFEKFHNELMHRFNSGTKGLVLFHGQPGTGKTYYIRHLLRKMVSNKKVVIYMPPNMVDHLVEPAFMTFLSGEVKDWSEDGYFCVLLIEDAEPLLAKRVEGVRIQGVTNLLNMTDGLLNDMLNLQIICTFNVDLRKLDSALLRPGRLIARKEFKPLSELDANLLAQRLGIKHHFKEPATLGEIYAMRKNSNTLIHDVESDRDASTLLDDL
jgi:SpoVK/Ycf46/Vps4 family AAA+-type ATPase